MAKNKSGSAGAPKDAAGAKPRDTGPAPVGVRWLDRPDDHDYPAAASYLSLLAPPDVVEALVAKMRTAPSDHHKAKDILRASRLPMLPTTNPHVASDLARVHAGKPLSPILMVRGSLAQGLAVQVADGYHRVCASYYVDENTDIPVVLVDL